MKPVIPPHHLGRRTSLRKKLWTNCRNDDKSHRSAFPGKTKIAPAILPDRSCVASRHTPTCVDAPTVEVPRSSRLCSNRARTERTSGCVAATHSRSRRHEMGRRNATAILCRSISKAPTNQLGKLSRPTAWIRSPSKTSGTQGFGAPDSPLSSRRRPGRSITGEPLPALSGSS